MTSEREQIARVIAEAIAAGQAIGTRDGSYADDVRDFRAAQTKGTDQIIAMRGEGVVSLSMGGLEDPEIGSLRTQLAEATAELEQWRSDNPPDYAEVQTLKAQLAELNSAATQDGRSVFIDQRNAYRAQLAEKTAECEKLNERLENNHVYNSKGEREEVEPGTFPDGIECRDETIRQQDEANDRLRAHRDRLVEAVKPFALSASKLVGTDDKVFFGWTGILEVTLGDFRRARSALDAVQGGGDK